MKTTTIILTFVALFLSINTFAQHAGNLDQNFNGTGIFTLDFYGNTDVINDIAVQEDGKVVACGVAFTPAFNIDVKIIRVHPDGTLDPDFNNNGTVTVKPFTSGYYETHAFAIYIKDDGKILIAGAILNSQMIFDMLLVQLNEDGSFDDSFGTDGVSIVAVSENNEIAQDVIVNTDGKILVAGIIENENAQNAPAVVRFNENGSLDETFGENGIAQIDVTGSENEFTSISLQNDGKIIASGHLASGTWPFMALVARFLPEGSLDENFGVNGVVTYQLNNLDDEFFGMDLTEEEEIVCGGFTMIEDGSFDMLLMKFDTTGSVDNTFGFNGVVTFHQAPYNVINDLKIQPDGKILVCGSIGQFAPGNNDFALLRYKENGGIDFFFGVDGVVLTDFFGEQDEANSVAIAGSDRIYLGGKSLNPAEGVREFTIAAYYNDLTTSTHYSENSQLIEFSPNPTKEFTTISGCENAVVRLYNLHGEIVKTWNIDSNSFQASLSGLSGGLYVAVVNSPNGVSYSKIQVY